MHQLIRNFCCFVLGAGVALSLNISSSEQALSKSIYYDSDYPLLVDVIDTIETYYVDQVDRKTLINGAIKGIFNQLDPYSGFLNEEGYQALNDANRGEYFGFGFEVATDDGQITIVTPFKDSPAERAGIEAGDKIIKFNDMQVDETNYQAVLTEIRFHSTHNFGINLTVKKINSHQEVSFTLQPDFVYIQSIESQIIDGDIGYIHLTSFQEGAADAIMKQAKEWQNIALKGIILDIRNNPGGLLEQAISIADLFLEQGKIVSTNGRFFDANEDYYASGQSIFTHLPMAVLINKGSASASEVLAAALQENHRATLLGETSFGKGTVQSIIPILGHSNAVKLTIANYSTPNGNNIHEKGIDPDIEISISSVTDTPNVPIIDSENVQENSYDQQVASAIAWIDGR
ncbi:S41 family peptidase [Shewanella subflava]|uniref:S41 family peptidase n=1 Tax=Shewanella subflava TaxID=2986476 RepID=A0ABT3I8C6_9GAMM|nr:S41 family peptidase [Shewanella subflava]MCW3172257.1 S41 family peptidase [Shewanella subflava]